VRYEGKGDSRKVLLYLRQAVHMFFQCVQIPQDFGHVVRTCPCLGHVDSTNTLVCVKQKPYYFTQVYLLITYYTQIIGPLPSLARLMSG
jgi:hypothetical protein